MKLAVALLEVYGSVVPIQAGKPSTPVTANFALTPYDSPGQPIATGTFTAPNVTQQQNNVLFWSSGRLAGYGVWFTLNVTSASPDYPFVVDYFFWQQPTSFPASSTTSSSTSPISNGLTLSASSTEAITSSPATSTSPASSHKSNHTGAIVGGVLGGVVFVAAVILLWFWLRARKPHSGGSPAEQGLSVATILLSVSHYRPLHADSPVQSAVVPAGLDGVTPFLLPRDHNTTSAAFIPAEVAGPITPGHAGLPAMQSLSKARLGALESLSQHGSSPSATEVASSSGYSQVNLPGPYPALSPSFAAQEVPPVYTRS